MKLEESMKRLEVIASELDSGEKSLEECLKLYEEGVKLKNYEAVCYALYYANKYEFEIKELDFDVAKNSNNFHRWKNRGIKPYLYKWG